MIIITNRLGATKLTSDLITGDITAQVMKMNRRISSTAGHQGRSSRNHADSGLMLMERRTGLYSQTHATMKVKFRGVWCGGSGEDIHCPWKSCVPLSIKVEVIDAQLKIAVFRIMGCLLSITYRPAKASLAQKEFFLILVKCHQKYWYCLLGNFPYLPPALL